MGAHGSKSKLASPGGPQNEELSSGPNAKNVDGLTQSHIQEFRDAFNSVDKDGSGSIDASELKHLFEECGENLTDDDVAKMMAMADSDGSGRIDFWEFVTLMAYKMKTDSPDDALRTAFSVFDSDGSGTVSEQEIMNVMREMGEKVSERDLEAVFRGMDHDGNGMISYDEFVTVVTAEMKGSGYTLF